GWREADRAVHQRNEEADWQEASAGDAEEDGNTFAALWHLDRLITLRPRDWQPPARQGLLYATAGEFERAESAYRLAARNAPAADLQNWHRQNAATCLVQGEGGTALRHLDWLGSAGGDGGPVATDAATGLGPTPAAPERE